MPAILFTLRVTPPIQKIIFQLQVTNKTPSRLNGVLIFTVMITEDSLEQRKGNKIALIIGLVIIAGLLISMVLMIN